jgi:hypothetical protein
MLYFSSFMNLKKYVLINYYCTFYKFTIFTKIHF